MVSTLLVLGVDNALKYAGSRTLTGNGRNGENPLTALKPALQSRIIRGRS
jgi:hypothetical protein